MTEAPASGKPAGAVAVSAVRRKAILRSVLLFVGFVAIITVVNALLPRTMDAVARLPVNTGLIASYSALLAYLFVRAGERETSLLRRLEERERRMRELQDLVIRVLGHDLKAPLTVIHGYVELVRMHLQRPPGEKEVAAVKVSLDKMNEAVSQTLVLMANARAITRLLDEATIASSIVTLDFSKLVTQSVSRLEPLAASKGQVLYADVPDGLEADLFAGFESVVNNVVGNAIKYTPPGGRIDVKLSREREALILEVADTGPGIPADRRALLFRKFERLGTEATPTEGHGLGLSIASKIVDLVGGTIVVGDRPDGRSGAVFKVRIPQRPATPKIAVEPLTSSSQAGS